MKTSKNVVILLIIFFALIASFPVDHNDGRKGAVSYGSTVSLLGMISVHSASRHYIEVGGRKHRNVKGNPPYFIDIPTKNSILFVTGSGNSSEVELNFLNIGTKKLTKVSSWETFGSEIGSSRTNGAPFTAYVKEISDSEAVLVTAYSDAKKYFYVDLTGKKLKEVVMEHLDASGDIVEQSTYVDGELVKKAHR